MRKWLSRTLRLALIVAIGAIALSLLAAFCAWELYRLAPQVLSSGTALRSALALLFTSLEPIFWFGVFLAFASGTLSLLRLMLRSAWRGRHAG